MQHITLKELNLHFNGFESSTPITTNCVDFRSLLTIYHNTLYFFKLTPFFQKTTCLFQSSMNRNLKKYKTCWDKFSKTVIDCSYWAAKRSLWHDFSVSEGGKNPQYVALRSISSISLEDQLKLVWSFRLDKVSGYLTQITYF